MLENDPKIVVIGGGTGSFTLLRGLKQYAHRITALVTMADDGGSTGQLRDELGVLPPGDVRQCLVALSNSPKARDLFNYRFDEGAFQGHAFGNIFLTALEKMTGNFAEAVELASEVLAITGRVEPVTLSNVALNARMSDGSELQGESAISEARFTAPRPEMWLAPAAVLNPRAAQAIAAADLIIVAPGNMYASLAPALIVPGMGDALAKAPGKKIYICNLVTKPGQTDGFMVHDFAAEIERFAGVAFLDYVVYNDLLPSQQLLDTYARDGEFAVQIDDAALRAQHYSAQPAPIIAAEAWDGMQTGDPIAATRTLIRHDSDLVARHVMKLYFS